MPVKYFVSKDYRGKEQAPDFSHETHALIEIIKQIYETFNHHQNLYALVANLNKRDAMADLVVLTERGLGIIEFKHYPGSITMRGTEWHAGSILIPGNLSVGYRNPHEQVQKYAQTIRNDLFHPAGDFWLPGKYADWQEFHLNIAIVKMCLKHSPHVSRKM